MRSLSFDQRSRFLLSGGETGVNKTSSTVPKFPIFLFSRSLGIILLIPKCAIFVTHLAFYDCFELPPVLFFQRRFQFSKAFSADFRAGDDYRFLTVGDLYFPQKFALSNVIFKLISLGCAQKKIGDVPTSLMERIAISMERLFSSVFKVINFPTALTVGFNLRVW